MANKERYQNPSCGDTIKLRLFTYNSNNRSNVQDIEKVEIFFYDPNLRSSSNPEGLRLVQTITGSSIQQEDVGQYYVEVEAIDPLYTIGYYKDVWTINFEDEKCDPSKIENVFRIYADLWFTTPFPPIYDFNFNISPNKIRKGSKRYIAIQIVPNVPTGNDVLRYYENLAIVSDIKLSMEITCGDCVPAEQDLRLIIDNELISYREKGFAYYFLDTSEIDEGIYNVWFELNFGENTFISDKLPLQIYS
jgi:hypothetical protein